MYALDLLLFLYFHRRSPMHKKLCYRQGRKNRCRQMLSQRLRCRRKVHSGLILVVEQRLILLLAQKTESKPFQQRIRFFSFLLSHHVAIFPLHIPSKLHLNPFNNFILLALTFPFWRLLPPYLDRSKYTFEGACPQRLAGQRL